MTIEPKCWPWKPSLFNQYRIRIANELRFIQRKNHSNELHHQISLIEDEITQLLNQIIPIDFVQIHQKLNSCILSCQNAQKQTLKEYNRIKNQLIHLKPKLLIGNSYLRARFNKNPIEIIQSIKTKKRRKRLKLSLEQQWKKGIEDAYRKFQIQRDKQQPIEPLPLITNFSFDNPPIIEHEFLAPLPPPPIDEIIIPFQTPPIASRSPPSDRLQLAPDDTIVKSHRLINKTLGNISHMSFHIDPDQCSSPKSEEKRKKSKLKTFQLPSAPVFSSTAIFDTHAFFTQTNNKTKKQKKKIDISRQPIIMTNTNKKTRIKKCSPYDFNDDEENLTLSKRKNTKLLTDDIITARFAKNSHYQTHQSSMASIKSNKRENKKKKNILGIGTSSPLTLSTNLTLSPGRLSIDNDDDFNMKSSVSKKNKTKRTRVK